MSSWERWNTHWSTEVEVEVMDFPFRLKQDPNSHHLGTTVWDASIVLAKYLEKCNIQNNGDPSLRKLRGKTVLELGSGMGLGGMVCALKGANVILTDQKEVLPLLNSNVEQNMAPGVLKGLEWDLKSVGNIEVCELDWLKPEQRRRFVINDAKQCVDVRGIDAKNSVQNADRDNTQKMSINDFSKCTKNNNTSVESSNQCFYKNSDGQIDCTFAKNQNELKDDSDFGNNINRNSPSFQNNVVSDFQNEWEVHEKNIGQVDGRKCDGDSKSGKNSPIDLILCADCVYNESLIEYLLDTVLEICGNKTTVLVVNEDRSDSVKQKFEDLFGAYFTMKKIPHSKMDPVYQHPKIDIFILKKRKESQQKQSEVENTMSQQQLQGQSSLIL